MKIVSQLPINFRGKIQNDNFDIDLKKAVELYISTPSQKSENSIFMLVEPKIRKSITDSPFYSSQDIYQEKILALLELLPELKKIKNPCDRIKNIISSDFHNKYTEYSDFKTISYDENAYLNNFLTREKIIESRSSVSNEKIERQKDELNKYDFGKYHEYVKQYFGTEGDRKSYQKIAEEYSKSDSVVRRKVISSILGVQIKENALPQETQDLMDNFKNTILKGIVPDKDIEEVTKKIYLAQPDLLNYPLEKVKNNITELVKRFEKEGLTVSDYIKIAIARPHLFFYLPDTVESNIRNLVELFKDEGLTTTDYLKAVKKQYNLFQYSPKTVEFNIRNLVKRFENEGLTVSAYLKAAIKCPQLFCMSPDTIERNIRSLVSSFEKEGLSLDIYLKCAIKKPSLFFQLPTTIEKNIHSIAKRFEKEGLSVSDCIKAGIRDPELFYMSPDTMEKNIRELVKRFKKEGLTVPQYIEAAKKQPALFYQSPESIERKVRDLVSRFKKEKFSVKEFLESAKKHPVLFCFSPDTLERKMRISIYKRNSEALAKGESRIRPSEHWAGIMASTTNSDDSVFLRLLNILMFGSKNKKPIPKDILKRRMPEYLRENPEEIYEIKVLNENLSNDFINFAKQYSESVLGKNVFNIEM